MSLLLVYFAGSAASALPHVDVPCGTISQNATWTAERVYVVRCNVTVASGVTLQLGPGTIVKLTFGRSDGGELIVDGRLEAVGTADAPVVFTSLQDDEYGGDTNGDGTQTRGQPGQWSAITFRAGGSGRLAHTLVRFGGGYYYHYDLKALVRSFGAALAIDHTTLQGSGRYGLYAENEVAVANSRIVNNADWGLFYNFQTGHSLTGNALLISDNVFSRWAGRIEFSDLSNPPSPGPVIVRGNRTEQGGGLSFAGELRNTLRWENDASFALLIVDDFTVAPSGVVDLSPGTIVKLTFGRSDGGELIVDGRLEAVGTADAPVVFTSLQDDEYGGDTNGDGTQTRGQPGQWSAITFRAGGSGRLAHTLVRFGGGYYYHYDSKALVRSLAGNVSLESVDLAQSGLHGLWVNDSATVVRSCRITDHTGHAVFNATPKFVVDARYNWWGNASGPHHPNKNPTGTAGRVSDGVLFFPWAVDEDGKVPSQVSVEGPIRVSPGDTVQYAVSYYAGEPLVEAVLVVTLPWLGEFVDATGQALHWPERNEVYWLLGHLESAAEGSVSLRVRYTWGLPDGSSDAVLAQLGATNQASGELDVGEYVGRAPRLPETQTVLSEAAFQAERSRNPALATLFQAALAEGFVAPRATRTTTSLGETANEVLLIRPERGAVRSIVWTVDGAAAVTYDRTSFTVQQNNGTLRWDLSTDAFTFLDTAGGGTAARSSSSVSFLRCFFNCAAPKMTLAVVKKKIKTIGMAFKIQSCFVCGLSKGTNIEACAKCQNAIKPLVTIDYVPYIGENVPIMGEAIDLTKCAAECAGQAGVVFPCREDLLTCDSGIAGGVWSRVFEQCNYRRIPCEQGILVPEKSYVVNSGCFNDFCKCVEGKGCVRCGGAGQRGAAASPVAATLATEAFDPPRSGVVETAAQARPGATCGLARTEVRVARDPNAKHGPPGDVVPGQVLEYTIEFENVGAGRAYGVYVTDELSPHLDETSLDLHGVGEFLPSTRTILWDVGELAPKGEVGSKGERRFSVRVREGLPSGTVIANRAIVFFPSVPEETSTNSVVHVVQPLAAIPQSLTTDSGTSLSLSLAGRDVSGTPLTYRIEQPPLNGTLEGTPLSLLYTPAENFTGQDRFTFTVSNGVSTSRPAEVTILVNPSPADRTAPEVRWTYPEANAVLEDVPSQPLLSDDLGPAYAPSVIVVFSEALDPESVHPATLSVTDAEGRIVRMSVGWDATANQVVLMPREPWQNGTYTVGVTTGVRDASGNALAAETSWSFRVAVATACPGDCDGNGQVTIEELIRGVNIALGTQPLTVCTSFDRNGDGEVTIEELIFAVNLALSGC